MTRYIIESSDNDTYYPSYNYCSIVSKKTSEQIKNIILETYNECLLYGEQEQSEFSELIKLSTVEYIKQASEINEKYKNLSTKTLHFDKGSITIHAYDMSYIVHTLDDWFNDNMNES